MPTNDSGTDTGTHAGQLPYHYGVHYSSSTVVMHYLNRLQPFSSYCVRLQGGRFDRPDRIFRSVQLSWLSASGGIGEP